MKYVLSIILLFTSFTDPVTKIAKVNKLKKAASRAYADGDFESAIQSYNELLDSLEVDDDKARLNLANAAYIMSYGGDNMGLLNDISSGNKMIEDTAALNAISGDLQYFDIAERNYNDVKESSDNLLASMAHNQLGVISYKMGEQSPDEKESFTQSALKNFKEALRKNPQNDQARYNYELLKKLIRQQEKQQQQDQDQNKDQQQEQDKKDQEQKDQDKKDQEQNKDKQDQEKKDQEQKEQENQEQKKDDKKGQENQEQKEGEEKKDDPMEKLKEKLKEMNIPLEKAQMILEAMKNNETQYVQQKKRKATQRRDSSKPDW